MRSVAVLSATIAIGMTTGLFCMPVAAQRPAAPPLANPSLSGREIFQFYCAPCHGASGKGDGPVAASLKVPPPDLTTIAVRTGGYFPADDLRRFVAGQDRLILKDRAPDVVRHVGGREDAGDARRRSGLRDVDGDNARVRLGAEHKVEHELIASSRAIVDVLALPRDV